MKVELANDLIARKIYEAASVDDKARAMASKFIQDRYSHFCKSKNILLSQQEIAFIQPYLDQLALEPKQKAYIERSRQHLKVMKRRKRIRDASLITLVCTVIFSSWGIWERQRYTKTHQHLTSAQDSIHRLKYAMRNAKPVRNEKQYGQVAPAASLMAFHTLNVQGRITNVQGKPVRQANVQVLGATVKSDNKGRYELHLVLPRQYWNQSPELQIEKEYYQAVSQPLDLDKDQIEWNPILQAKN